ncbi:TPA: antitoxin [Candidatus Acetothermia bacterium]|nr:antitoxin [Candidatus Acetothermia bacterium]
MMEQRLLDRIEINPRVMVGKPVIRGTRVPVQLILKMLSQGISAEEIVEEYPHLTKEDIQAALAYAAETLAVEEVLPLGREVG